MEYEFNIRDFRKPIFWVLVALGLITLFLAFSELFYSFQLNSQINRQNSLDQYNSRLTELSSSITAAESGQRGYLITQNSSYLKPYIKAIPQIKSDLRYLQSSPISQQQYSKQVKQIVPLIEMKLNELNQTITTDNTQGQAAAYAIVNTDLGRNLMTSINSQISNIISQQSSKFKKQENVAKSRSKLITAIAPAAVVINMGLIYLVLLLARRAIIKERQLEGSREQFVTVASHQLRTPATAVKQYLFLLLDGYYGELSKEQRRVLELINTSNERGISVANSLLSVTRADNGQINISAEPVNLSAILEEVVDHYKVALKQNKNQQIIIKAPKKHLYAKVDAFYMKMVFENLIDNASKYSSEGKKIFVTLKKNGQYISFSVRDQGIGVKENDLPKLFRKFSRLDSSFRINSEGSGLGLYLVKQLVKLHGGEIKVDSKFRQGSTFTVSLKEAAA